MPVASWDSPKIFCFADLELDEGQQRVLRDGVEVPLPKLSFDLLLALLESAPNYVSNRQLMAQVWPGLVIADKTVSQRVKLLRDALGDDREEPRYVAGLRGRGYRVPAQVNRIEPGSDERHASIEEVPRPNPNSTARRRSRSSTTWITSIAVAGALIVLGSILADRSDDMAERIGVTESDTQGRYSLVTTIAVLPFRNLSDNEDDYIALGVPEMILDELAAIKGLTIIARNSSFRALDDKRNAAETGRVLGAMYLVEGSVQRAGKNLRISVQLVDSQAGTQIWARRFDREIDDIFAVQDEIAASVASALGAQVADPENLAALSRPTTNIEAYLAFLRGRVEIGRWTVVDADAAVASFQTAIELDPNFAAAYASLYDARLMAEDRRSGGATARALLSGNPGDRNAFNLARAGSQTLIDKALALDPKSGAAYFARAIWADDASATREADFRRGLDFDPSNGRGIEAYAEFLDRAGRGDEADTMLKRAMEIDPLSPRIYFWQAMRHLSDGPAVIEAAMLKVLEIDPDYVPALQRYAKYRWIFHGELAEAIQLVERALAIDPDNPWLMHTATAMYLDIGDVEAAKAIQSGAERPEITGSFLIQFYQGDVAGAGLEALQDSAFAVELYENWGVYEALRDWAKATGDYRSAIKQIENHTGLGERSARITLRNFRAVPALAEMQMAEGNDAVSQELLRNCIDWIDDIHLPEFGNVYALRVKANALLLLGDTDRALDALGESFAAEDYLQWWYTLYDDPLWASLHDDEHFKKITAHVQSHIEQQSAMLAELRQSGLVPHRSVRSGDQK